MEKKRRTNRKYSPKFKLNVILDMRENNLSYHETMRKYFADKDSRDYKFVKQWERIYLEEGAEGLMKEKRGRAKKADIPSIGRPKKLSQKAEEDLITENQRLRMENEYLKKLIALVQSEKEKENATKHR